jgi:hypothetical protein
MARNIKSKTTERPLTLKERAHKVSVYFEPEVYDQLRAISYTERIRVHSLILEGVEFVIKKHAKRTAA